MVGGSLLLRCLGKSVNGALQARLQTRHVCHIRCWTVGWAGVIIVLVVCLQVLIDMKSVENGTLYDDFEMLAPKKIKVRRTRAAQGGAVGVGSQQDRAELRFCLRGSTRRRGADAAAARLRQCPAGHEQSCQVPTAPAQCLCGLVKTCRECRFLAEAGRRCAIP